MNALSPKYSPLRRTSLILIGAIATLIHPVASHAATRTWSGVAGDGLWDDPVNWGGTMPVTGDTALFNSTGSSISLDAAIQSLTSFTFDTSTGSFSFNTGGTGGQFNLASGGNVTLASTATGINLLETFNTPISLGGNYTFANNRADTGSALVFAGNITNTATSTLTLSGTGTGTGNSISGNISDGTGIQSVNVSASAGKWTLSGANSYSGTTTLSGGATLVLAGTNNSAGATTLSSGTLQLNNTSANDGGLASGTITMGIATIQSLVSNLALSNNIVVTNTATISGANSQTFNGSLTNSGGNRLLNNSITGGNTLTLAGNIYLSESNVLSRTFTLGGNAATFLTGTIADSNGGGAPGTLAITNTAVTTLSGANTYSGGTNINAGTLSVSTIGNVENSGSNLGAGGVLSIGSTTANGKLLYTGAGESTDRVVNLAGTTGGATIDQSGSGLLTFTSSFTATGAGSKMLTLQGSTSGAGQISGAIVDNSSGANNTAVTKTGTGTWTLAGSNTYSGNTIINGGSLVVTSTNGLGNSAASNAVSLISTGRLSLLNDGTGNNGTIIYGGVGNLLGYNLTAANTPSISVGDNTSTNTGNTFQLGTLLLTNATLTVTNGNNDNLSFSGVGSATGSPSITNNMAGGTATLAGLAETDAASRSITFNGGSNTAVTSVGVLSQNGSNALNITQSGAGELILTGTNTYTGITTVNTGTLLLDMNAGGSINGATGTSLTLGGGSFQVKGAAAGSSKTMGTLTLTADTGSDIFLDSNNGAGVTLTLGSTWTRGAGSSLLIDYSSPNSGTRQVVTAAATTGATLTNGIYGWLLVKDSNGIVGFGTRAAGTNMAITRYDDTTGATLLVNSNSTTTNFTTLGSTYTGGNGGSLSWTNGGGLANRSVNSLTTDTTNNYGTIDLGASTNTLAITSQAILFKGPNDETVTGGKLGASASELIIHQTGTGVLTVDSLISGTTGSLTVDGTGTTVLDAANVYTGVTSINGGVLNLGSAETPGTSGPLGKQAATAAGTILFSGGTLQYSTANNFDYSGRFSTAVNQQISIDTNGQSVTFATALMSSGGSLTTMGSGSLNLSASNTYTGATNVNAGTLVVSGSLNGTASVNISAGATLATGITGTIATGVGGNVNVAGSLAPGGSTIGSDFGTLNLSLGVGGKLDFAPASSLLFGLGSTSDLVAFSTPGNWLSGSGNAVLNLDVTQPGFSYASTYTIFQNVTTPGFVFANIHGYDTADWRANLFQSGSNYELSFTAVPEPGTTVLVFGGLGLMTLLRKRRFAALK